LVWWYRYHGTGTELVQGLEEVRENYEPWAARRRTEEDLKAIRHAYESMVVAAKTEGTSSPALVQADLEFHQTTLEATHNVIMIRIGLLVRPVLQIRDEMALRHDSPTDFLEDHRAVLEAIEKQQPGWAEECMRDLLDRSAHDTGHLAPESKGR